MNKWLKITAVGAGLIGAGAGLTLRAGNALWKKETGRMIAEMESGSAPPAAKTFSEEKIADLPLPVWRYFKFALKEGQPLVRAARLRHAGEFYLNDRWIPFESEEYFSAAPAAFVWDAKMKMKPLINVRVRDSYRRGQGAMRAKILSLFTVMNAEGANEKLASGTLQRFLAEAVWLPTALLPSENLQWSEIDDAHAGATLTDSGVTVSLEFEFGRQGEIAGTFSPARYKETDGKYKAYPWAGRFRNYQEYAGMMIPFEGEVEWQMPEGNLPYWRGKLLEAEYFYDEPQEIK